MPPLQEQVPLAPLTTLAVGGSAEYFVSLRSETELQAACRYAAEAKLPLTVLGGGSNVLVPDEGVSGLVVAIALTGRRYEVVGGTVLATIAAGEVLDEVVADTVAKGYWGLENLSHIPGQVGATPVQNVGAYGVEVSDIIESVRVYDRQADAFRDLSNAECSFAYRDSKFKQQPGAYIVTAVTYRLQRTPAPQLTYQGLQEAGLTEQSTLEEIQQAVITIRSGKFPDWHRVGTAGSFFKNPIIPAAEAAALVAQYPDLPTYPAGAGMMKVSLGFVLDKVCDVRGYQEGNIALYEKQALVLVAYPGATATEVEQFAGTIAEHVKNKTGLSITREVTTLTN